MLTYDEYIDLGGGLDEAQFTILEAKAAQRIHRMTHGRLLNESPLRDCAKYAVLDLIAAMNSDSEYGGREVASMSNDGLSASFVQSAPGGRYAAIVTGWLQGEVSAEGVELLYCGVSE